MQDRLQAGLDVKDVEQLKKDRETIGESLFFLRQYRDALIVELCEAGRNQRSLVVQAQDDRVAGKAKRRNLQ